jgi:hypothetical protein
MSRNRKYLRSEVNQELLQLAVIIIRRRGDSINSMDSRFRDFTDEEVGVSISGFLEHDGSITDLVISLYNSRWTRVVEIWSWLRANGTADSYQPELVPSALERLRKIAPLDALGLV